MKFEPLKQHKVYSLRILLGEIFAGKKAEGSNNASNSTPGPASRDSSLTPSLHISYQEVQQFKHNAA